MLLYASSFFLNWVILQLSPAAQHHAEITEVCPKAGLSTEVTLTAKLQDSFFLPFVDISLLKKVLSLYI